MKTKLNQLKIQFLKEHNSVLLNAVREVENKISVKAKMKSAVVVTNEDIVSLIKKCISEHRETLSFQVKLNNTTAIETENQIIEFFQTLLPVEKSESEIKQLIQNYLTENNVTEKKSMGVVMKWVSQFKDVDKQIASKILSNFLQ